MSCSDVNELLGAYIDGELPDEDRQRVADHLVVCPRCATEMAALRSIRGRLASQGLVEPPAGFWTRVSRALDIADAAASEIQRPRPRPLWLTRTMRLAPTSLCLVLLAGALVHQYAKVEPGAGQLGRLARAHADLAHRQAGHPAAMPAASTGRAEAVGYSQPWETDGRPVDQLLFRRGDHVVSVFELPTSDFDPAGLVPLYGYGLPQVVMTGHWDGVNVAAWRQSDSMIVIASEAEPEYVVRQARSVLTGHGESSFLTAAYEPPPAVFGGRSYR